MAPSGPKMAPRWPQVGPKWPQDGPKVVQDGPKMPQDTPRWSKMAPRWPQEAPRWPQYGPKMAQDGPKMGSRWAPKSLNSVGEINMFAFEGHLSPKMAPSWPQEAPRWPKMAPRWPQDGPVRQKTYTCACGRSDQDDSKKAPRRLKTTIVTARAHVYAHSRRTPTRGRVGIFQRPWPLGRPARAVLFFLKNTQTGLRGSNTPWAGGPANCC